MTTELAFGSAKNDEYFMTSECQGGGMGFSGHGSAAAALGSRGRARDCVEGSQALQRSSESKYSVTSEVDRVLDQAPVIALSPGLQANSGAFFFGGRPPLRPLARALVRFAPEVAWPPRLAKMAGTIREGSIAGNTAVNSPCTLMWMSLERGLHPSELGHWRGDFVAQTG
jgi:hypothetical protein